MVSEMSYLAENGIRNVLTDRRFPYPKCPIWYPGCPIWKGCRTGNLLYDRISGYGHVLQISILYAMLNNSIRQKLFLEV